MSVVLNREKNDIRRKSKLSNMQKKIVLFTVFYFFLVECSTGDKNDDQRSASIEKKETTTFINLPGTGEKN